MEDAGFHTVEASIRCLLKPLREKDLPRDRSNGAIRSAEAADEATLLRIARSAFHFGRYHTDARFPRPLADRRFEWWMEQAIKEHRKNEGTRLLVLGEVGEPRAFMHLVMTSPTEADLRLAAVDPQHQRGMLGYNIFNGTLHYLAAHGCREAIGKISSTNIAVMNIYAGLGFRFQSPEMTMHWHAAQAPNLLVAGTSDEP
jgi:GNAT superfamily N-acetyltransferase